MDLDAYLSLPDSPSVSELRRRMLALGYKVRSDAQIRQWRYHYAGRVPSPENCVGLELATDGAVSRREMCKTDWRLIWPELSDDNALIEASDDAQPPVGTSDSSSSAKNGGCEC